MYGSINNLQVDVHILCHCVFMSYLSERLAEFSQNALLIKHLALVSMLVVVMDFLSEVGR